MKILLVAATDLEVEGLSENLKNKCPQIDIQILITGIGVPVTIYSLLKKLQNDSFDLVINVGIAGAFSGKYSIGDVVQVVDDVFSDVGVEDDDTFIPIAFLPFFDENQAPFTDGHLLNEFVLPGIPAATAITSNTVHGNDMAIRKISDLYNPDIETMEGAACFFVCLQEEIKFLQIRSVSNIVEKRNKDNWNIPLAISSLHRVVQQLLINIAC